MTDVAEVARDFRYLQTRLLFPAPSASRLRLCENLYGFTPIILYSSGTPMDIQNLNTVSAFTTKDGSEIRELLAHRNSAIRNQSLAEARLPAGASTAPHYHPQTEEIYYITEGYGRMQIGDDTRDVVVGDAIAIPPGLIHQITNTGTEVLKLLCCCAPAYEHDDTVLVEL